MTRKDLVLVEAACSCVPRGLREQMILSLVELYVFPREHHFSDLFLKLTFYFTKDLFINNNSCIWSQFSFTQKYSGLVRISKKRWEYYSVATINCILTS